jgi:hypothetical protein
MSYFGNEGPPQDGGFISGIARGNARLNNAKNTRARYQKGLGNVSRLIPGMSEFPPDEILYQRTKNFSDGYLRAQDVEQALADGRVDVDDVKSAEALLTQYEKDKQLIAEWAESGPYVHENKALMIGSTPVVIALGLYVLYRWQNNRPVKTKASKSWSYAVFGDV